MTEQCFSGVDRRTVVRAGVATAWAVPLVQAVGAAPAFAVSGPANLSTTTGLVWRNGRDVYVSATVRNTGGSATVGLTAVITVRRATGSQAPITFTVSNPPSGWTGAGATWASSQQVGAGQTRGFGTRVRIASGNSDHDIRVTVTFSTASGTAGVVSEVEQGDD